MSWLLLAALVYMVALYGALFMVQAQTEGMSVLALIVAAATSGLWVAAMYLIFRGLVEVGVFDALMVAR